MSKGILAVLLAGAVLAGCSQREAESEAKDTQRAAGEVVEGAGQMAQNAALTAKVKSVLGATKGVDIKMVNVNSQNGVVTLIGHVETQEAADAAVSAAKNTEGVKSVVNKLHVGPMPEGPTAP